jgi:hypothetical protein
MARLGAMMVNVIVLVAVCGGTDWSITVTGRLYVPLRFGVPEMTPLLPRVKPSGSAPGCTDHANGAVPATAVSVWEYGVPGDPFGSNAVVMVNAAVTVSERVRIEVCDETNPSEVSATWTTIVYVPGTVGVPLK